MWVQLSTVQLLKDIWFIYSLLNYSAKNILWNVSWWTSPHTSNRHSPKNGTATSKIAFPKWFHQVLLLTGDIEQFPPSLFTCWTAVLCIFLILPILIVFIHRFLINKKVTLSINLSARFLLWKSCSNVSVFLIDQFFHSLYMSPYTSYNDLLSISTLSIVPFNAFDSSQVVYLIY